MRRLEQLINLPVILGTSGERIGRVCDVRLDESGRGIAGVGFKAKGIRSLRSYVPMQDIEIFGAVSVIVSSRGVRDKRRAERHVGKRVVYADGEWIGWMTNLLIDDETGTVEAIEVSRGYVDDVFSGRLLLSGFTFERQRVVADRAAGDETRGPI